jgi:peptidoglycan/LPS O-acetylase OafA/YrhL
MTLTKPSPNRLQWIDHVKGAAILAIVTFHFFQNYPDQFGLVAALNRTGAKLGYAAVDIFFVMAGFNISFVIATKETPIAWKTWLQKRVSRLYPEYWLAVVCSLLLFVLFRGFKLSFDLKFILSCLGLAGYSFQSINPGFWFFTVILEAYLVTPLLFKFCQKHPERFLIVGASIGILTKTICAALGNGAWYSYLLQTNFLGSYLFQYCLGLYWGFMYVQNRGFRRIDWWMSLGIFAAGLVTYIGMSIQHIDIIYMLGFDIIFTPFMFMALRQGLETLSSIKRLNRGLDGLAIMGLYSYQIYLIHQPLMSMGFPYLAKLIPLSGIPELLLILIIFMALLPLYVWMFLNLSKLVNQRLF